MGVPTSDKEYAQWVKKTTDLAIKEVRNDLEKRKKEERQKGKLLPNKEKQEEYEISQVDVLKSIASLFQQVGDTKKAEAAILPFLKQLKEIDKETWQHTLSELTSRTMRMHSTALKLANEDAKTADDFWGYVGLFYNDQEYIETLWDALTSRKGVTPKQSFDDLAVLMHMRLGDEAKREVLIDSILKEAKKGGAEDYGKMMLSLRYMCQVTHNYLALQKIMKSEIAEEKNAELLKVLKRQYGYVCYLNKDWKEFMKYEKFNSDELHNSSDWYTKRSIAYRALGKNAEADKFIDQAILLTLGIEENLYTISRELAESGDFKRSNQMLTKIALVQGKNVTNGYTRAVFSLIGSQGYYFENEMWDQASAYSNISACLFGVDEKDFADFSPALVTQAAHMQRFSRGMQLLQQAKQHYTSNPGPILKHLNSLSKTYSTKKPSDWTFNTNDIHLIGIRRKQTQSAIRRENDDLFVLLINGMTFTFWGSTDASVNMAGRKDEAFLIEGQHLYRFGWHKISVEKKIYRALKPQKPRGVMIIRDWDNDNAYTDEDIKVNGLRVNPSINIHWTGIGRSNFSAGCQVIAGKSYLNHKNDLQDCSKFASASYGGLTTSNKKTKGAYNVFTDLILCYAPQNITHLYYTLGREDSLNLSHNFGSQYAENVLNRLKSV